MHEYARGDTAKKKKEWVVLNEAARNAFHQLKKAVMSAPVLAYPDPNKEYLLEMDALKLGPGAVLSQKQSDGRYYLVAFRSRTLHGVEVNYHSTKLKFLAMKWSIEHFQTYLLGCCFKVHMDNNPLMYFLTSPNMDATKQRWINELAKYDFSLEYQKGKNNTVADALSRISEEWLSDEEAKKMLKAVPVILGDDTIFRVFKEKEEDQQPEKAAPHAMSSEAMKAVFNNLTSEVSRRAELEHSVNSAAHHEADSIELSVKSARLSMQMHVTDWAKTQREDPEIKVTMVWCRLNKKRLEPWTEQLTKLKSRLGTKKNTPEGRSILQNADKLTLSGGLLYYRYKPKYQIEEVKCFVVPRAQRRTAIHGCPHDAGHQDKKRTESLISDRFWWPGVFKDVNRAVQNCRRCQLYGGREEKAPMVLMMVTAPLQLVHLDFTSFKMTKDLNESPKVKHVLVIVDHFMRYTRTYVTKDWKALTVAKTLYEGFISIFGASERILMDQGQAFTSEVMEQLCSQFRISQSTITAYHPQKNSQVE